MARPSFTLTLSCPNRPGIVAAVAGHLYEAGCNSLDAQQFDDTGTGRFFMRVEDRVILNGRKTVAFMDGGRRPP